MCLQVVRPTRQHDSCSVPHALVSAVVRRHVLGSALGVRLRRRGKRETIRFTLPCVVPRQQQVVQFPDPSLPSPECPSTSISRWATQPLHLSLTLPSSPDACCMPIYTCNQVCIVIPWLQSLKNRQAISSSEKTGAQQHSSHPRCAVQAQGTLRRRAGEIYVGPLHPSSLDGCPGKLGRARRRAGVPERSRL